MPPRRPPAGASLPDAHDPHTKFVLYLEQIMGAVVPRSRRSKGDLYKLRACLDREPRFLGRALLYKVIDQLSDYL